MHRRPALRTAAVYVAVGSAWIVVSDRLSFRLLDGMGWLTPETAQLYKGLLFVVLSGVLVFLLVRRAVAASEGAARRLEKEVVLRTTEINTSKLRLEDLYDNAPCGYHSLDPEGRFVRINDTELRWLGYQREELTGKALEELLDSESRRTFRAHFFRLKELGEDYNLEVTMTRKDGSLLPALLGATALFDEDRTFRMTRTSVVDMTQIRAARDRIETLNGALRERNRELEIVNRDLESFSYSVSHDLRAPVRAVTGFADIIRTRYGELLPEQGRHYLENILAAGARMNRLIGDLLRYAKLGVRGVTLRPVAVGLVVGQISDESRERLAEADGTLSMEDDGSAVRADPSLLGQVLSNLVQNAILYREPQRPLQIQIKVSNRAGDVAISVIDNGIGIPEEHQEQIFALFQRLQHDSHEGTGIGLALARRAAEQMHGTLTVTSQPGIGSAFVLTLPGAPSPAFADSPEVDA